MGSKKVDAVIVLGMHRSGTSCMSEVLMNLGLYPGDSKEFLKASEYNKHGYFENSGVVDCNEKILTNRVAALIKGNHNPLTTSLPGRGWIFGAWQKNILEGESLLTEAVVQSLEKNKPEDACLLIKDPRFCLTLGSWKEHLNIKAAILMVRDPNAVAGSLLRRQSIMPQVSQDLWNLYTGSAISQLDNIPGLIVDYDCLTKNSSTELSRVVGFLKVNEIKVLEHNEAEVLAGVDERLNHSRQEVLVSMAQESLYQALKDCASIESLEGTLSARFKPVGTLKNALSNIEALNEIKRYRVALEDCKSILDRLNNHPVLGKLLCVIRYLKKDKTFGSYVNKY
jgi:hypothetical protein